LPDLSSWDVLARLAVAAALGGAIGTEREIREREAGLRTHLLVAVGAALFTLVSAYAWRDFRFSQASGIVFDPTRISAQIVTGIGFLGAGAIIRQGLSVRGLLQRRADRYGDRARYALAAARARRPRLRPLSAG
jgi:putative Mg2+ transporter-C (MgtC) family protein